MNSLNGMVFFILTVKWIPIDGLPQDMGWLVRQIKVAIVAPGQYWAEYNWNWDMLM